MTDYNLGRVVGTDGVGIQSISSILEATGRTKVVITLTTGTTETFYIEKGTKGDTGTGIRKIELISTVGKEKNYRITFTDNTTFDYTISDGEDAVCDTDFDEDSENALENKVITGAINTINTTLETKLDEKGILQLLYDYGHVSDGTVSRITLVSDKDILSYADGDVATLTATVYDNSDNPVSNQIVVFYKNGKVLDTGVTDANGEATYEYESAGVGDIVFGANVGSLLTKTFVVQDCTDYQELTSNAKASRWSIPSQVVSNYSSNGWKYNGSSYCSLNLETEIVLPSIIEFKLMDYDNHYSEAPYMRLFDSNKANELSLLYQLQNSNATFCSESIGKSLVKGAVYRIELTTSVAKLYENDTLIKTVNRTHHSVCKLFDATGTQRYVQIKDLKIKPL